MSTNSQCPPTPIATSVHQPQCQSQSKSRPALPSMAIVIDGIADCWTLIVGGQSRHPATQLDPFTLPFQPFNLFNPMKRLALLLPLLALAAGCAKLFAVKNPRDMSIAG